MSGLPAPGGLVSSRPIILRRLTRLSHMASIIRAGSYFKQAIVLPVQQDFEMAIWELGTLLIVPRKVYRDVYYRRRETKFFWRNEPSSK